MDRADDELVLLLPREAVLRDAASNTRIRIPPGTVYAEHAAIGKLNEVRRISPKLRPPRKAPRGAFVFGRSEVEVSARRIAVRRLVHPYHGDKPPVGKPQETGLDIVVDPRRVEGDSALVVPALSPVP